MSGAPPAQASIKGPAPVWRVLSDLPSGGLPACGLRWNSAACAAEPASTQKNQFDGADDNDDWSITTPGPIVEERVTRFM